MPRTFSLANPSPLRCTDLRPSRFLQVVPSPSRPSAGDLKRPDCFRANVRLPTCCLLRLMISLFHGHKALGLVPHPRAGSHEDAVSEGGGSRRCSRT